MTSIFSPEQLNKIVSESLPTDAEVGEHIIVGTVDQHGAQVVASFRSTPDIAGTSTWELQAAARHEWTGDNSVGAKVLLRW